MPNLATVTIIGHLGRDPEIRYMPDGSAVCNFSVATSEKSRDQEYTTWWRVNVWGKQAESCKQYLSKGRAVCVQGRVGMRSYTDNGGVERQSLEVNAQQVVFLGGRDNDGESSRPKDELEGAQRHAERKAQRAQDDDSSIPF